MKANELREKNLLEVNIKLQSKIKDLENELKYKDRAIKKGIEFAEKTIMYLKDKEEDEEKSEDLIEML